MISKEKDPCAIMLSMDNFGEWLLKKLESDDVTQSELSRRSGLSRGTISNIISGTRGRGLESITAIADALKIPPEEVFLVAIGRPWKEDDAAIKEAAYRLQKMPPTYMGIVNTLIDSVLKREENEQKIKEQKAKVRRGPGPENGKA